MKGFLVEKGTPGFTAEKMEGKMALRVVQNALITLQDCRVSETDRLQNARSFKDTAAVLRMTRGFVAWQAVGCAMGAYEHARAYAVQRQQFGRPIGRFQLVQDLLVQMLGNVTASLCLVVRLSQLQAAGVMREEENNVGRFVADAEAIYSYEGTREINVLVVGRAITGLSAFV